MLRCREGDLAIVLRSARGREGAILSVMEFAGTVRVQEGEILLNAWRVSPPRTISPLDAGGGSYYAQDADLFPIRPGDLKETEEREKELTA